jgi:CheY-like chemotaxis protein
MTHSTTRAKTSDQKDRFLVLVDSDAKHLFYTAMLLRRFEYDVRTGTTASEAVEMMAAEVPVLVITAYHLPDMSGPELITQLRQGPRTSAVPAVVLTTEWDLVAEQRSFEAGAAACLSKPVSAEELYQIVQAATETIPRKNVRIRTMLPVIVNGVRLDCTNKGECATVLSEHGMYVRTLTAPQVNDQLAITMVVKGRAVSAEAVVRHRHTTGGGPSGEPGIGLKFVRIAPADQEFIRQYIREEITKGIEPEQSR